MGAFELGHNTKTHLLAEGVHRQAAGVGIIAGGKGMEPQVMPPSIEFIEPACKVLWQ